jgi:Spy/CpxP family protein refolding chaperone
MKSLTLILGALTLLSSIASATASHRSSSSSQDGRYQHLESRGAVVGQKGGGRGRVINTTAKVSAIGLSSHLGNTTVAAT